MKEKEFMKRIGKMDKSYEEILMRLSELGSEAEKSYKQKCIDLINKTNEDKN